MSRPACYPPAASDPPLLDVLTSPVPAGRFDSPTDHRHVLCLHLGSPVPVTWRAGRTERAGVRLHGQFCVVPAESSTRWTLSGPARSLLLRVAPDLLRATALELGRGGAGALDPAIHIRDRHIEHIGWMMQAEERDGHPGGRVFADSLASALAARLLALQTGTRSGTGPDGRKLPPWILRQVTDYIEAHLERDLTLAELAAVAGYSLSHFKALFRAAAGTPVHRFVLERRVERARQRLLEGRLGMTEIALEAGFSHSSHMARCVRRLLGHTPAELRG